MQKVLVLNASNEPLNLCDWHRAVRLICKGKAEIVERNGRLLAPGFPMPRVIRLRSYVYRPFKALAPNRENVIHRDRRTCQYCGRKKKGLTLDHVLPRSRGGRDTWTNLVAACHACNERKDDRTPEEAGMPLLSVPYKPTSWLAFEVSKYTRSPEDLRCWLKYLRNSD
jgi:5-methylcytosine-specific restriction endonuclease McrA